MSACTLANFDYLHSISEIGRAGGSIAPAHSIYSRTRTPIGNLICLASPAANLIWINRMQTALLNSHVFFARAGDHFGACLTFLRYAQHYKLYSHSRCHFCFHFISSAHCRQLWAVSTADLLTGSSAIHTFVDCRGAHLQPVQISPVQFQPNPAPFASAIIVLAFHPNAALLARVSGT